MVFAVAVDDDVVVVVVVVAGPVVGGVALGPQVAAESSAGSELWSERAQC